MSLTAKLSNSKKAIALVLATTIALAGCSNSDIERQKLKNESEYNYGVQRTVKVYSTTGELVEEWHGCIDVDYAYDSSNNGGVGNTRIDLVFFDGQEAVDRIVISGNAIVVVDNDK